MKRLCIVPARGGSKRLPKKNIRILNNKPLISHTLDLCLENFDTVLFTSDDDTILDVVKSSYNVDNLIIDKRPEELAVDTSKVIDTVLYYTEKYDYDQVWLCLPTCPLKIDEDIKNAISMLDESIYSVISYTDMEFPPTLGLNVSDDEFLTSNDSRNPWENGNSRSQDHPDVFRPNGAIYGAWSKQLKEIKNYYGGGNKTKGYYMPRERSIDIDTEYDFKLAEFALNEKRRTYFIDIDNTICKTEGMDYEGAKPWVENIKKANKLYDDGHVIIYWTARGAVSKIDWRRLTEKQLAEWGVKYHELRLDKPAYDMFIDDKNMNTDDW
jgi:CMP-N-acetylneuraminic acid synthetase